MNERTKKIITAIVVIVIFVVCIGLIIVGQRNIGPKGLLTEIVGLAGLVGLLAFYNSRQSCRTTAYYYYIKHGIGSSHRPLNFFR